MRVVKRGKYSEAFFFFSKRFSSPFGTNILTYRAREAAEPVRVEENRTEDRESQKHQKYRLPPHPPRPPSTEISLHHPPSASQSAITLKLLQAGPFLPPHGGRDRVAKRDKDRRENTRSLADLPPPRPELASAHSRLTKTRDQSRILPLRRRPCATASNP